MSTAHHARPASAAEEALREAAGALRRDADRIAGAVADLLGTEVEEASFDPLSREETRRTCRATLLALLDAWRRGESVAHLEPPSELRFQIEVLARDGVPLRPFTRMCHLAHGAFLDAWDAELSAAPLPRDVQLAAIRGAHQLTFQWFDTLLERLTRIYESEQDRLARTPETMRRAVVQSALTGKSVDVDALSRSAGYEFRRLHVGLVLWHDTPSGTGVPAADDAQPAFLDIARRTAESLGSGPPLVVSAGSSTAWAWIGLRQAPRPGQIHAAAGQHRRGAVAIAIGDSAVDLEGFRATHEDAVAAARVAMLQGPPGAGRVIDFDDVELAALLSGDPGRARRFVLRRLGELARDDAEHARLRHTMRVHLQERGNRPAAARRLEVHPNTVSNRVRAGEALLPALPASTTGTGPELEVALLLAETLGPSVLLPGAA